jgi:hypothetical protein
MTGMAWLTNLAWRRHGEQRVRAADAMSDDYPADVDAIADMLTDAHPETGGGHARRRRPR